MRRENYDIKGGTLSALHFGDETQPVKLVMLHANGLNAQSYRGLLEPLGVHALSLDLRGHGMTQLPINPKGLRNFYGFRDDVVEFVQNYIEGPVILSGHSLGAVVSMLSAPILKDKMAGYVGFDLPLLSSVLRVVFKMPGGLDLLKSKLPIAVAAGRRRSEFDSLEQAFGRYKDRGIFKGFPDATLWDYVEGGFIPSQNGYKLACNPKWEQSIFPSHDHDLFGAAKQLPLKNTKVVFATSDAPSTAFTRARMRGVIGKENVERLADTNHMFPLNQPDIARPFLLDAIKRAKV